MIVGMVAMGLLRDRKNMKEMAVLQGLPFSR